MPEKSKKHTRIFMQRWGTVNQNVNIVYKNDDLEKNAQKVKKILIENVASNFTFKIDYAKGILTM